MEEAQNGILRFLDNHDGEIILDEDGLIDKTIKLTQKQKNIKKFNYVLSKVSILFSALTHIIHNPTFAP